MQICAFTHDPRRLRHSGFETEFLDNGPHAAVIFAKGVGEQTGGLTELSEETALRCFNILSEDLFASVIRQIEEIGMRPAVIADLDSLCQQIPQVLPAEHFLTADTAAVDEERRRYIEFLQERQCAGEERVVAVIDGEHHRRSDQGSRTETIKGIAQSQDSDALSLVERQVTAEVRDGSVR